MAETVPPSAVGEDGAVEAADAFGEASVDGGTSILEEAGEFEWTGALEGNGALPIFRAAQIQGAYRWAEHRLFALTGRWAAEAALPAVRVQLDALSMAHAWHAELWADRLPALDGIDHDELTQPSGPVLGPLFEALVQDRPDDARASTEPSISTDVWRLSGLARVVLPRFVTQYRRHRDRAVTVAEAPTIRVLRLVADDEAEAAQIAGDLLAAMVVEPTLARVADARQDQLEAVIGSFGGGPGLSV